MTTRVILVDVDEDITDVDGYIRDEVSRGNYFDTGVACTLGEDSMLYISATVDDDAGDNKYRKVMEYSLIICNDENQLTIDDHDRVESYYDCPNNLEEDL